MITFLLLEEQHQHKNGGGWVANCGHAFDVHATDRNFPDSQRCFHNAATGEGCRPAYDDRCKQYVDPDEVK